MHDNIVIHLKNIDISLPIIQRSEPVKIEDCIAREVGGAQFQRGSQPICSVQLRKLNSPDKAFDFREL